MNNKKFFFVIVFLMTTLVFVQFLDVPTLADVGNTFGNSGSSSDSDSGSYSSSSSGGDVFWMVWMLFRIVPFPFNLILIAVVFFLAKGRGNNTQKGAGSNSGSHHGFRPKSTERQNNSNAINKIKENDEGFSKNEFINYVNTVFLKVQEAWEARDWNEIRPFESNELFERHDKQLNEYIEKKLYPHLDKQEILSTSITDYELDGKYEYLTVQLVANIIDFTTDENNNVVSGSKTDYRYRKYKLNFKRVNGVKTKDEKATNVTNCPNCGAPSNVTSSGKCEYCSSVITTGEYGWVLDEYSQWRDM